MRLVVTVKRLLVVTLSLFLCTGCNSSEQSSNKQDSEIETFTSDVTQSTTGNTSTTVDTSVTDDTTNNIQIIDLNLPENSNYLEYYKEFTYGNEHTLSDGRKIVEDTNLYLEDLSGNKTAILEVPEEETEKYVVFGEMIDDNRFSYYIAYHESIDGSGVYNLENGERKDFYTTAATPEEGDFSLTDRAFGMASTTGSMINPEQGLWLNSKRRMKTEQRISIKSNLR